MYLKDVIPLDSTAKFKPDDHLGYLYRKFTELFLPWTVQGQFIEIVTSAILLLIEEMTEATEHFLDFSLSSLAHKGP